MYTNVSVQIAEVADERARQDAKWGQQNHPDGTGDITLKDKAKIQRAKTDRFARSNMLSWLDILAEEVAEAFAEDDPAMLREELIQVAAVAVAWIEAIDRRSS